MTATPALEFVDVCKSYGDHAVLDQVTLSVLPGEVVTLIGPSGSGKTTLLRCANLLEPVTTGEVSYQGKVVNPVTSRHAEREHRAAVGFVFQRFNLWPHMTALENVAAAPVLVKKESRADAEKSARALLARVGLAAKANHYPHHLSGGQQQRVAIARALAMKPAAMLFDEPTSALDPENVGEVLSVIGELAGEGFTMMIATHEMDFARSVSNRVVFMDAGAIVESGSADQVFGSPTHERTRKFLARLSDRIGRGNPTSEAV